MRDAGEPAWPSDFGKEPVIIDGKSVSVFARDMDEAIWNAAKHIDDADDASSMSDFATEPDPERPGYWIVTYVRSD